MKKYILAFVFVMVFSVTRQALPHCEIPCGIYDDKMRISLLREHISTIEKSMEMINELSVAEVPDYNQITRWVINKEDHANKIQEIVSTYFMTQRIKISSIEDENGREKYFLQLALLHGMLVKAMEAKRSTDTESLEGLKSLLTDFEKSYF